MTVATRALPLDRFRMPGVRLRVAESGSAVGGSVALKDLWAGHLELTTMRVSASTFLPLAP